MQPTYESRMRNHDLQYHSTGTSDYQNRQPSTKMNLVLILLITKANGEAQARQELNILKIANVWLQRKQSGFLDSLLLIGEEFQTEGELKDFLSPYGLVGVDLAVLPESYYEVRGELVESVIYSWLDINHPAAIAILGWQQYCSQVVYPADGWWWTGGEAKDDELSEIGEKISKLVPVDFKKQASTWLALLLQDKDKSLIKSDMEGYEACMLAIGLSRWLTGFDAISGNSSYNFSYEEAVRLFPLNLARVAFEAGRTCDSSMADVFDAEDTLDTELDIACLRHCLTTRNAKLASSLKSAFGGETALLWASYSSIWPQTQRPMQAAVNKLVSLDYIDIGDFEPMWFFASEGWCDFADE
jgi:hypothetical protein